MLGPHGRGSSGGEPIGPLGCVAREGKDDVEPEPFAFFGQREWARALSREDLAQLGRGCPELSNRGQVRGERVNPATGSRQAVGCAREASRVLEQLGMSIFGFSQVSEPFGGTMSFEEIVHACMGEEGQR